MSGLNTIQQIAIFLIPVLFAITLHEVAHGWAALRLGDRTAQMLGRLTVNPLKHIDPVGTVLVPLAALLLGGVIFGWARPVPVNQANLRRPRAGMALVALAGPSANLLMALFWALLLQVGLALWHGNQWLAVPLVYMSAAGVFFNLVLMALNLLPILPLDGGRVLDGLLPPRWSAVYSRLEPYGLFIVLGLLLTGLLGRLLWPMVLLGLSLLPGGAVVAELFLH